MSNITEYKDLIAFHPGYYIAEIIDDRGVSLADFASELGVSFHELSAVVSGQIGLSDEIAEKLSAMLGTSADMWINIQNTYNDKLAEIEQTQELDRQTKFVPLLDYCYLS